MAKRLAKITYHTGKSFRMVLPGRPVVKFIQNRTVPITDPEVIDRCKATAGFSVDEVAVKVKKKVRKPLKEKKSSSSGRRRPSGL